MHISVDALEMEDYLSIESDVGDGGGPLVVVVEGEGDVVGW